MNSLETEKERDSHYIDASRSSSATISQSLTIGGIKLKKEVKLINLCAIFYTFFMMTSLGGYCNVQIVYLLRDESYFGIQDSSIGRVSSGILFVALVAAVLWTTICGQIFDLFGRRFPLLIAGVIGSVMVFVMPFTSPNIVELGLVRAVI